MIICSKIITNSVYSIIIMMIIIITTIQHYTVITVIKSINKYLHV